MTKKTEIKKVRCNICSAGCPIDAYVQDGKLLSVEGSRDWPGQQGGLCSKGAASRQYVYNKDRILYPMKRVGERGSGEFERISWEEAYAMIANNLLRIREKYGSQSTVFYAGYPKWYRPALLRLANAYGSPNYCTESSTCFQSAAMAWRSIYGNNICFPDMMHAKTVLVWSNNLYYSNISMAPMYQSLKERGVNIISVDPRETVTSQAADLHLKLIPGTDGALALSMGQVIIEENLYDHEFVEKYGLTHVHRSDGICHQLMTEAGYVKPGDIAFGTDSHTTTYGCVGAFSSGIGYTEMASILGTGTMWIKVPETIKVVIDGELPENVMSKDIILRLIGDLRADGATYRALEFSGSTIENMSVASRMTMANMAIEAGAKCALFTPDEKTAEYCEIELNDYQKSLVGDEDAVYMKTMTYKAEDFVPVMACPSQVDKIRNVSELEGTEIDQVFIGSCTNGRLEDLRAAAEVLKGKKVADFVKLIVTPASRKIYRQALADGTLDILAEAGAIITHPGCGLCCGRTGGILSDGERVVATNNRNFLGRMGTSKVEIYLASPRTAAACAVAGKIVNPE